jgi:pyruvate/2-oxoglutarate dehydrogenase complex dihydrolipoamide dehydrogenase (E3) component
MPGVQRRKRDMVDNLIDIHLERYRTSGAELIMGEAHLTGERTVQVKLNDGGSRALTAEKLFLNVGTRPRVPDIHGLAEANPMTHVEALDLDCLPEHLIVVGGGYVGLELAQTFRRFGSQITIIESGPRIMKSEDAEVSDAVAEMLRAEGIEILLRTSLQSVAGRSGERVRVELQGPNGTQHIEGSHLLIATGRTPNTQALGLDKAGVERDSRGYIKVNERLETTAANTWAMGECAGSPQFTHVAFDDFRIVRDNLGGGNRTTANRLIPYCLFTDPELVRVGLSESEAKRNGVAYRLAKLPMAAVPRTKTISEPRGFMKILIDAESDRILGFTAFGAEASELLAAVQTAMLAGSPYRILRDAIYAHPTIAEGLVFLLSGVPARANSGVS